MDTARDSKQAKSDFLTRLPRLKAEVDRWLENWPSDTREGIRRRAFSPNTGDVYSALLELYVHEIVSERFTEISYEPSLPNTENRPEFLARDGLSSVLVECTVVSDEERIRVSNREITRLVNLVNTIQSDYGISIRPEGRLAHPITPRKVGAFLRRELSRLPRPIPPATSLVYKDPPTSTPITFELLGPNDPSANAAWMWWPQGGAAVAVTAHERIKEAVDEKATRYANQGQPFLIVVWPYTDFPSGPEVIRSALYGYKQIDIVTKTPVRRINGAFTRVSQANEPICTRVSAVGIYLLHFNSTGDYEHRFAIFHNPYASCPLHPSVFTGIPQFVVQSSNDSGMTLGWHDGFRPNWWD